MIRRCLLVHSYQYSVYYAFLYTRAYFSTLKELVKQAKSPEVDIVKISAQVTTINIAVGSKGDEYTIHYAGKAEIVRRLNSDNNVEPRRRITIAL